MDNGSRVSGIGVLDKAVRVLDAVVEAAAPLGLGELAARTGLPRATAHRLASALAVHGFLAREGSTGAFAVGPRVAAPSVARVARPALERLRDRTGESVQLYVRRGPERVCVVSLESPHSLRTIVAEGASLPLDRGSAGRVLSAGEPPRWAESVEEREKGVASVSAPVRDRSGAVVAAVSVSGPVERTTRSPGRRYANAVVRAAREVERALSRPAG